jgi:hypothetical protein
VLLFLPYFAIANMAEPVTPGTLGSRPFTSQYVDVIKEDLTITINPNFQYADFEVRYFIHSDRQGTQIPLLFYASEYLEGFSVNIDGRIQEVSPIPEEYQQQEDTFFEGFSYFFEVDPNTYAQGVEIKEGPSRGFLVNLEDMLFFTADLEEGIHVITVTYRAIPWTDGWDWVNAYSFRYALSPAKYWRSFGALTIRVDASAFAAPLETNLESDPEGDLNTVAVWDFNALPTEILHITYQPKISNLASSLIAIGPQNLAIFLGILLLLIHLFLIRNYRIKHPAKRISPVVVIGSLLIPLIVLVSWTGFYPLIDSLIGPHASGNHGYTFIVWGLYPFILPLYGLLCWGADRFWKKQSTAL